MITEEKNRAIVNLWGAVDEKLPNLIRWLKEENWHSFMKNVSKKQDQYLWKGNKIGSTLCARKKRLQSVKMLIHYPLFLITKKCSQMLLKFSNIVFSSAFACVFGWMALHLFCELYNLLDWWPGHWWCSINDFRDCC